MEGYYVVMAKPLFNGPVLMRDLTYEEYSGRHWGLDQNECALEELWDAQHDGEVEDPYIKEVIF